MQIQILGIGCPACRKMESDVREIVSRCRLQAAIIRIDDPEIIARMGVLTVPSLIIDDEIVMCGYKGKDKIERLLLNR